MGEFHGIFAVLFINVSNEDIGGGWDGWMGSGWDGMGRVVGREEAKTSG